MPTGIHEASLLEFVVILQWLEAGRRTLRGRELEVRIEESCNSIYETRSVDAETWFQVTAA